MQVGIQKKMEVLTRAFVTWSVWRESIVQCLCYLIRRIRKPLKMKKMRSSCKAQDASVLVVRC